MRIRMLTILTTTLLVGSCTVCAVHATAGRSKDLAADPAAFALLKEAYDRREAFPADFSGLSADILLNDNGTELKGSFTY